MNIRTTHVFPPIPVRNWDWLAEIDGDEEGPKGWGRTKDEAVADLKEQMDTLTDAEWQSICKDAGFVSQPVLP